MIQESLKNFFRVAAFSICFVIITNQTKAQFSGGDGTSENPYQITTATELTQLATYVNAGTAPYANVAVHYKLGNNITLSSTWTPIGNSSTRKFRGVFDGDSNIVNNLSNLRYGMFGYVDSNGVVKNLGFASENTYGYASELVTSSRWEFYRGIVVGHNQGCVSNCYAIGSIRSDGISGTGFSPYHFVGGVV